MILCAVFLNKVLHPINTALHANVWWSFIVNDILWRISLPGVLVSARWWSTEAVALLTCALRTCAPRKKLTPPHPRWPLPKKLPPPQMACAEAAALQRDNGKQF